MLSKITELNIAVISAIFFLLGIVLGELSSPDISRISQLTGIVASAIVVVVGFYSLQRDYVGNRPIVLITVGFAVAATLSDVLKLVPREAVEILYDLAMISFMVLFWKITSFKCRKLCINRGISVCLQNQKEV